MQAADRVGHAAEPPDEIGEDAVDAGALPVKLLMRIRGGEELRCRRRQRELRLQIWASPGVGEVEVEPQPTALPLDCLAGRKFFRDPVVPKPKGPNEPRQGLRLDIRNHRQGRRQRLHGKRPFSNGGKDGFVTVL